MVGNCPGEELSGYANIQMMSIIHLMLGNITADLWAKKNLIQIIGWSEMDPFQ